jgi:hypothetical protein
MRRIARECTRLRSCGARRIAEERAAYPPGTRLARDPTGTQFRWPLRQRQSPAGRGTRHGYPPNAAVSPFHVQQSRSRAPEPAAPARPSKGDEALCSSRQSAPAGRRGMECARGATGPKSGSSEPRRLTTVQFRQAGHRPGVKVGPGAHHPVKLSRAHEEDLRPLRGQLFAFESRRAQARCVVAALPPGALHPCVPETAVPVRTESAGRDSRCRSECGVCPCRVGSGPQVRNAPNPESVPGGIRLGRAPRQGYGT